MVARVGSDPPRLPRIVSRQQALDAGMTRDSIRHRVRGGHWMVLEPGMYLRPGAPDGDLDAFALARVEHARRCVAAVRRRPDAVIGYGSAAVLKQLPLVSGIPRDVQLIVPEGSWTGTRNGVHSRLGRLPEGDVDRRQVPHTTATRTWIDVARTHDLADALSAGDRGLRLGLLTADAVRAALPGLGRVRGRLKAEMALAQLDARRETPLESLSWALFLEWGLPLPLMQQEFRDDNGLIGRVDFYWPQFRLVGEADGRLKYETREALYAEKLREDRLRARGLGCIRWGWLGTLAEQERLRTRLESAFRAPRAP